MRATILKGKSRRQSLNMALFCAIATCYFVLSWLVTPVLLLYFIGVLATIFVITATNKDREERKDTVTVFLVTLTASIILVLANYLNYIKNGFPFLYPDQIHFYEEAKIVSAQENLMQCIKYVSDNYREYQSIYILNGILGYTDRLVTGKVNLLPLLFSVAYFTALIPTFFYHTVKIYLPRSSSFKSSLYLALATPMIAYSGYLLRDIHLTLVFSIVLFWVVRKVTLPRIIGIIILFPIVAGLRIVNIFLLIAMLAIFLFNGNASKIVRYLCIIAFIACSFYFALKISELYNTTISRLEHYNEFTNTLVDETSGIGKKLYSLPTGIKEVAIILNGLISFPFWGHIDLNLDLTEHLMLTYSTISNFGWFFTVSGLFFFVKPLWGLLSDNKNRLLLHLFLLSFLYIASNVSNMTTRRIMYVYPIIMLPFLIVYHSQSSKKRQRYFIFSVGTIVALSFIYILMLV